MSNIIPFDYLGRSVRFSADGWINATEAARRFGKKPSHWLELPSTKSYMAALIKHMANFDAGKSDIKLVNASRVRGQAGTWLHPKLAVAYARWLDVDFAVWCDFQIDSLIHGSVNPERQLDAACKLLGVRREKASQSGRELARWRWDKRPLEQRVEYWREQLQMTLPLEKAS